MATARPPAVLSRALAMPPASSSVRPRASPAAITLNVWIMPSTVPIRPSSGPTVVMP